MTPLHESVRACVADHFHIPRETITPSSTLEDLGMDSLALVELVCVLEEELGLRAPADDAAITPATTFAEAVATIERAQQPQGAQPPQQSQREGGLPAGSPAPSA